MLADMIFGGMKQPPPILERAFQIANDGSCRNWMDVAAALKREGYATVDANLSGPLLRKQIDKVCGR